MPAPDLILHNGRLITLDDANPGASAMAIRDGQITFVGDDVPAMALRDHKTTVVDLLGKTVVPGFNDAHLHLSWYGQQLLTQADLVGCESIDEMLERLTAHARRTSGWIQGHGFDQEILRERRFPTRAELDRISTDRPIVISRICGHAAVANSAALARVSAEERSAGDEASGLFTETAITPFYRAIPPLDPDQEEEAVLRAAKVALRSGVTSVQTMLDVPGQMGALARLHKKGKLPIRVAAMPPYSAIESLHAHGISTGFGDDRLRFGACKVFSDGSLGARTALLAESYADDASTRGTRIHEPIELKRMCRNAQSKGFQLAIHAIGDQALRETIDAIEFALDGTSNEIHRHRVEHASICPPDCVERLARNQIVTVIQPQFVTSDPWTPDRLGADRAMFAYPTRSLLNAGVPIALSSDCPIEKLDAFACLRSVTRRQSWSPHETIGIKEALARIASGAHASNREQALGRLKEGYHADFVVVERSIDEVIQDSAQPVVEVYVDGVRIDL